MRNPDPPNYFASKYSLPHVAACLVVRGSAGFAAVDDSALERSGHRGAAPPRPHHRGPGDEPRGAGSAKPARVTVTLKDGRQATHSCDSPRGDCLNPYDPSEIRQKFRELAGLALTPQGVEEVESAIDGLERWTSASVLTDLLRRHCRPEWR